MVAKVLVLEDMIRADYLGDKIARDWHQWNGFRQTWISEKNEIRKYIYATDTTETTNSKLPWKNKTTIPKLCQIRDNLYSNYMAALFPKRKWMEWEADNLNDQHREKKEAIEGLMEWCVNQPQFKTEIAKIVQDYIDYGNCFATVDWVDDRVETEDNTQVGYVGPMPRRISPLDIVMNPTAPDFAHSPKIVRSLVSLGEAKELLERISKTEETVDYEEIYKYLKEVRNHAYTTGSEIQVRNDYYNVDGFGNYNNYLDSDYVELLTFYGDIYDRHTDTLLKNHMVVVADRHKVLLKKPNPSYFGTAPIFHAGWRTRQDNLWAMGPLDNLVGMQYRIDHIENLKADLFDLVTFPPVKITGYVEDFEWGPLERIYVGDDGNVELLTPNVNTLNINIEINQLEAKMEEMAGAPKEAMGFRTPGEKTAYEVQRLENAAARIFQSKVMQFEEQMVERLLNGMLELARRNLNDTTIRIIDDEYKIAVFQDLTKEDITGSGRIRPVAARNYAEKAEIIQNLTNFYSSAVGADQDIKLHFSSVKVAQMIEQLLDLEQWRLVEPNIRVTEQADAQRMMQSSQESVLMEGMTPSGLTPDDVDEDVISETSIPMV